MVATLKAIKLAQEVDFRDVILEGNNLSMMNYIRSNEEFLTSCGATTALGIIRMSRSCNRVRFSFVKRG